MKAQSVISIALAFSQGSLPSLARSLRAENQSRSNKNHERIIGGYEAPEGRHSYAVSLRNGGNTFCAGSLIAKDVVLTAAHCGGRSFDVVAGRHDYNAWWDGEVIGINKQLSHPSYRASLTDNDFMLVFLRKPVTDSNAKVVKINNKSTLPNAGSRLTVMGWGDTDGRDNVSKPSNVLMKTELNAITNNACEASRGTVGGRYESYSGSITDNMLCAKADRRDSCQGDSGGPLVVEAGGGDVQVGVVSWGLGCASQNFPGVYARVSRAYDWIEREVCGGSQYARQAGFDCSNSAPSPVSEPSKPSNNGGGGGIGDFFSGIAAWWNDLWGF